MIPRVLRVQSRALSQSNALHVRTQIVIFLSGGSLRLLVSRKCSHISLVNAIILQDYRWIFTLYLAMDANFRLKLRERGIKNDPELGPGWAYFVNDREYQQSMSTFGDQKEVRARRTSYFLVTDIDH